MTPIKTRIPAELLEVYSRNDGEPGFQFDVSALTAARKITMPDADVDLSSIGPDATQFAEVDFAVKQTATPTRHLTFDLAALTASHKVTMANQDVSLVPGTTFAAAGASGPNLAVVTLGAYASKSGSNAGFATIVSGTLPSLVTGDVLRLKAKGVFSTITQNVFTVQFKFIVDAHTLLDLGAQSLFIGDTSTDHAWEVDALVRLVTVAGASSFHQGVGTAEFVDSNAIAAVAEGFNKANTSVDLSGALAASLQVAVAGGGDGGTVVQCVAATLERVRT